MLLQLQAPRPQKHLLKANAVQAMCALRHCLLACTVWLLIILLLGSLVQTDFCEQLKARSFPARCIRGNEFKVVSIILDATMLKHIAYDKQGFLYSHTLASGQITCPWLAKVEQHAGGNMHLLTAKMLMHKLKCLVPRSVTSWTHMWSVTRNAIAAFLHAKRHLPAQFVDHVLSATAEAVGNALAACKEDKLSVHALVGALNEGVLKVLVCIFLLSTPCSPCI